MPENSKPRYPGSYSREGINTISEVSAFLGGLFFTSLILLFQYPERFNTVLLETRLFEGLVIRVTQLYLVALLLAITVILFIFSAVFCAIACTRVVQEELDEFGDDALIVFLAAFVVSFISIFAVLCFIDVTVGIVGVVLSIVLLFWWIRKRARMSKKSMTQVLEEGAGGGW